MPHVETRNEKLDLRLTPSAKRALQIAAAVARRTVMDAGNRIRKQTDRCDFFAMIAAARLASSRTGSDSEQPEPFSGVAHVIVSLKRPEEVETFRRVYGAGFFLIGVFATEQER